MRYRAPPPTVGDGAIVRRDGEEMVNGRLRSAVIGDVAIPGRWCDPETTAGILASPRLFAPGMATTRGVVTGGVCCYSAGVAEVACDAAGRAGQRSRPCPKA